MGPAIAAAIFLGVVAVILLEGKNAIALLSAAAGGSGPAPFSTDPNAPAPADAGAAATGAYDPVGAPADGSPGVVPQSKIAALAQAIATAEGFFTATIDVPQRANNPGDLTKSWGFPTFGTANAEGVLIFGSLADGWGALHAQCAAMLSGSSHVYDLGMTILQVAQKWTGNDNPTAWAHNVASKLGVSTSSTLGDFLFA